MPYRAVIFDMDGTLLNTLADIAESTNRILAERGFPQHPIPDYRYFVGAGARNLIFSALPENERTEENINVLIKDFEADYLINWKNNTKPYKGVDIMLNGLVAAGLKMAILSNKPHHITLECAEEMLMQWPFDVILGQREGIPKKPDPAGALEIAEILDIPANEFLYVGDTKIDMQTATAAGMFSVGVSWGFRPIQELIDAGAEKVIDEPIELLDLLV